MTSAEDQLRTFLRTGEGKHRLANHNAWLEADPSLSVYVRKGHHAIPPIPLTHPAWVKTPSRLVTTLDIASVSARRQGQGRFTQFLEFAEQLRPYDGILVENVLMPRFAIFMLNRGYKRQSDEGIPCFYKLWERK